MCFLFFLIWVLHTESLQNSLSYDINTKLFVFQRGLHIFYKDCCLYVKKYVLPLLLVSEALLYYRFQALRGKLEGPSSFSFSLSLDKPKPTDFDFSLFGLVRFFWLMGTTTFLLVLVGNCRLFLSTQLRIVHYSAIIIDIRARPDLNRFWKWHKTVSVTFISTDDLFLQGLQIIINLSFFPFDFCFQWIYLSLILPFKLLF